jgi:hypothetical protein
LLITQKRENNSMGTTKGTSQRVTQLGTLANMAREQQGNSWERLANMGRDSATREQLGTFANMGTEQQGNVPIGERECERQTAKTTNVVARIWSFVAKVWRPPSPTFFFVFVFFWFFPPHGRHMVCVLFAAQSVCVCVCVCVFYGEDGTLSLLF